MTSHHSNVPGPSGAQPKQAVVLNDVLFPMPRAQMAARDILDQCGQDRAVVLQRDYNSPVDHIFADHDEVDLRQGNVFRTVPRREPVAPTAGHGPPKLAFVADDAWEVTVTPDQTGRMLKSLLGLPESARLFRDYHSPHDQPIGNEEVVHFSDGPVFTVKELVLTIKVNNQSVTVHERRLKGLQIKEAAMAQGVKIKLDFVLYALDRDGNLGPAIPDGETVKLHECKGFRCVAPDDNS